MDRIEKYFEHPLENTLFRFDILYFNSSSSKLYPMIIQRIRFMDELFEYQDDNEQTDDITMIGLKV